MQLAEEIRSRRPERIGVLGGTFDPPHIGHLAAAVNVRWSLGLDRVLLVVANDPWQKRGSRTLSSAADRLALVEAAALGLDGIEADDREIRRGGASYTADTVAELRSESPAAALFVVVGRDAAAGLPTWERASELAASTTFAVVDRPADVGRAVSTEPVAPAGFRVVEVDMPQLAVSSTLIRSLIVAGRPIDFLTTEAVRSEIGDRRLYSEAR